MQFPQNRRRFLQMATVGAAASLSGISTPAGGIAQAAPASSAGSPIKLGMASYTLRKFSLDQALAMTKQVGLEHIALKSMHLPLDSGPQHIKDVVAKVKDAGLELYGGGVIYMRKESDVRRAFEYAKAAGMKTIIGVPSYDLLPLVDELVQQYDIKVAIHNHGPTDKVYPIPAAAYAKVKDLDKRIGLCNDIGHTTRAGVDVSESARKYADRLHDVHIKDVSSATRNGHTVEVGRGVIDIPKFLKTLIDINYSGIVSFEYEKDANDPMAGLAESVGYVKGVLAAI